MTRARDISRIYKRTAAEIAAGVTPTDTSYPAGDVRRYGATLDGVTDDTASLTNWASVGGDLSWPVAAAARITNTIPLVSNTTIRACKGAVVQTATTDISLFSASSKSSIHITDLKFKQTAAGATAYVAGVKLTSCTDCTVENCEFEGMQWSGVMLASSSRCTVRNNYVHDSLGTIDGSNDIALYDASYRNFIAENTLNGGGWHGITLADPYSGLTPAKNIVQGNKVGVHEAYGILVYIPSNVGDTFNTIIGNYVEGITGAADPLLFGSGIYVVGYGAGGTVVSGNTVVNCCVSTTGVTNGPAGISIAGLYSSGAPVVVTSNIVNGMTKFWGILAVTNIGIPVVISNNSVTHPTGNTTGEPIRVESSSRTSVIGNNVICSTASGRRCLAVYANSLGVMSEVVVANNILVGGGGNQIDFIVNGGGTFARCAVSGNIISGGANSTIPIYIAAVSSGAVVGNVCNGSNTYPMYVSACTNVRITGNVLTTGGSVGFGSAGTCTGSYFDKTNLPGGLIENNGAGLICEQLGAAAPVSAASYGLVGDRVEQSVSAVGQPKGWRCTVAGNPGTWVSEGNL
jgi:parallel beta-helix repeat protein